MAEGGIEQALARLERAVERLDRAAAAQTGGGDAEIEALRARHERLRDQVRAAVTRIDDLIAERG